MKTYLQKAFIISILLLSFSLVFGQIPAGYYNNAIGKTGETLRTALCSITTNGHIKLSYTPGVWDAYAYTDVLRPGSDTIWDMYSDIPGGTPSYYYTLYTEQCGTSSKEGDCYSREHCLPNSCWGGITSEYQYSDLHHLFPCDQYVNVQKSNNMIGETIAPTYISSNGSKTGPCSFPGYTGKIFEPIDAYKGDFARAWLYMATRYMNNMPNWAPSSGTAAMWSLVYNSMINNYYPWVINMFLNWCSLDPVSQKEIDRNNAIYYKSGQHNRNPYIDHPEYVCMVWGTSCIISPTITNIAISPVNPTMSNPVNISASITDNGSVANVILYWDVTPGTFSNSIAMTVGVPPTYTTSDTIPRQLAGTTVYYKIVATDNEGNPAISDVYSYNIPKGEPTNHPTGFSCGTNTSSSISLIWLDAVGTILPSGYLIKMSPVSFTDITNPSDGTPVADGTYAKNILIGIQTCTFNGLTSSTPYYFKIFAYSNSGSNINYKLIGTIQSTSCNTSASGGSYACLSEGFVTAPAATFGWTFTNIGTTYTSSGNFGVASPSVKLDATGDQVITPIVSNPIELKFWIKGQTATGSYLLVEGYNGSWIQIDNILMTSITTGTTKIYNSYTSPSLAPGFTQFRFTYTKSLSNVAFDDVSVTCGGCVAPTNQAGGMLFNSIGPNSMIVNWARGNGNNVLVLAREGSTVNSDPGSGISYVDSDVFGSGDIIGTGNYVVYNGPASSVEVNDLLPNTRYYFSIYEYTNAENCYKTPGLTGNEITSVPIIIPTLTTSAISSITTNSAVSGGNITSDGGSPVTDRGLCWNTLSGPTIANSRISNGSGTGSFTSILSGLIGGTTYYVRAYATNANGTAYGNEEVFITLRDEPSNNPTVLSCGTTTTTSISVSWLEATGSVLPHGYLIKASPSGFSAITDPVDGVPETDGTLVQNVLYGANSFTFTGLSTNTAYYFKIYSYSNSNININYKTDGVIPSTSCNTLNVPSTIVFQGFEATSQDIWNYEGGNRSSANKYSGTYSGKLTSGQTMTFANINLASYTMVNLSVAFSGINVRTNENLYLDISFDNGISWTGTGSIALVTCNQSSSARSVAFGATSSNRPITVSTNPWIVCIPVSSTQIAIRLRCPNMNSGDAYYVDDIRLSGLLACTTPVTYNVTGGGSYCSGGTGVAVGLSNSEIGVTYQLYRDANIVIGADVQGNGSAITFGNQINAGIYTVVATNISGSCTNTMDGSATVSIFELPTATLSYSGTPYLTSDSIATASLTGIGAFAGGMYTSTPSGLSIDPVSGTIYPNNSSIGTYKVSYTKATEGGCSMITADCSVGIDPGTKTLTIKIFVEGLYVGGGLMNEALDYDAFNEVFAEKWGTGIADTVTVELYDVTYGNRVARYTGVNLYTNGLLTIPTVNASLGSSYYITIFHRNSVPITSALPLSFSGTTISYDFTFPIDQAYGAGLAAQKDLGDGFYGMYTGAMDQVYDPDYVIDVTDLNVLEPVVNVGPFGYLNADQDGSGFVDITDLNLLEPNVNIGPRFWNPLLSSKK
jgi:endonuclease I